LDKAEIVSMTEEVDTPAGLFRNCLKTRETTDLEPDVTEYKLYAPGIGLVQDGELKLIKYAPVNDDDDDKGNHDAGDDEEESGSNGKHHK
jgi:hypothetical protein